jgi:hypothetical protein
MSMETIEIHALRIQARLQLAPIFERKIERVVLEVGIII